MTKDQGKQIDGVPGASPASQPGASPASQPPVQQPPPGRGTNWPAIILGGVLIVVLIALLLLIIPQLGGEVADQAPPATAPPGQVEVVIATREPRPTREQAEQPAQPAEGEAPAAETPGAESPPEQGQQPAEGDSASGLPGCSSLGLVGGLVVLGGVASSRKRRV